jgi:hypothetical protein
LEEVIIPKFLSQVDPLKSFRVRRIFRVDKDKIIFDVLLSKVRKNGLQFTSIIEVFSDSFGYLFYGDVVGSIRGNSSFDQNLFFLSGMSISDLTFDKLALIHVLTVLNRQFQLISAVKAFSPCGLI